MQQLPSNNNITFNRRLEENQPNIQSMHETGSVNNTFAGNANESNLGSTRNVETNHNRPKVIEMSKNDNEANPQHYGKNIAQSPFS